MRPIARARVVAPRCGPAAGWASLSWRRAAARWRRTRSRRGSRRSDGSDAEYGRTHGPARAALGRADAMPVRSSRLERDSRRQRGSRIDPLRAERERLPLASRHSRRDREDGGELDGGTRTSAARSDCRSPSRRRPRSRRDLRDGSGERPARTIARSRGDEASDLKAARSCSTRPGSVPQILRSRPRRRRWRDHEERPAREDAAGASDGDQDAEPDDPVTPTAAAAPLTVQQPPFVTRPKSATRTAEPTCAGATALSRSRPRSGGRVDEAAASRSRERARQAATTDARAANRMPAAQRARIRRAEAVDRRADAIAEQGGEAEHGQKGQESPATLPHVVSSGDSASGLHSRSRHGTAVA